MRTPTIRRRALTTIALALLLIQTVSLPARGQTGCEEVDARLIAIGLTRTVVTDPGGQEVARWSGLVPSWDGMPLSIDVTLAADGACSLPLLSLHHGWSQNKTSHHDTSSYNWNSTWFASRGYVVLTSTARGLHGSCGPPTSTDGTRAGLPASCTDAQRHYWIDFNDARYSVRDAQWLIGLLVDTGLVDADRIGVSGASMGGGFTWLAAVANDRIMCGGIGWNPSNGLDPCTAVAMGGLVPWRSPQGVPLHIAAAVPWYGYGSLINVLLPNGRAAVSAPWGPISGMVRTPIGVPVQSWLAYLRASGSAFGFFEPPGLADTASRWGQWFADLAQPMDSTMVGTTRGLRIQAATAQWRDYKSAVSPLLPVDARVPIFAIQPPTDGIMPPVEAQLMWTKLKEFANDYPIAIAYVDVGHRPAANRADALAYAVDRGNVFLDYHLRGIGEPPQSGVSGELSRCRPGSSTDPLTVMDAPDLLSMPSGTISYSSSLPRVITQLGSGLESALLGPVGIMSCPSMPTTLDAGVASWQFFLLTERVLAGQPVVKLTLSTLSKDVQLNVRLWDRSPDGMQTLISRGTYRHTGASLLGTTTVRFEIPMNFWRVPAGDMLKLEVTGYDAPHFQASALTFAATITKAELTLPM